MTKLIYHRPTKTEGFGHSVEMAANCEQCKQKTNNP